MKWVITYTVSGFGQFPIDMLRYDRSFPAGEMESAKISRTFRHPEPWIIKLMTYSATKIYRPTEGRWQSFCCRVSDVESRKLLA